MGFVLEKVDLSSFQTTLLLVSISVFNLTIYMYRPLLKRFFISNSSKSGKLFLWKAN